jgi:hypothetical protein
VAARAGTPAGLVVDWSRPWHASRSGHERVAPPKGPWLKPFLVDLAAEEDPNLGVELVPSPR